MVAGLVLAVVSLGGTLVSMLLNHKGALDNGVYGPNDAGIWSTVFAVSVFIVLCGAFVMLVQGLLWLVRKAMGRS